MSDTASAAAASLQGLCTDLKKNSGSLSMVNLNGAGIGNDGARALATALKFNTKVVVLFLNQNQLQGHCPAWKLLTKVLAGHYTHPTTATPVSSSLTHLYLSHNLELGDHGITILAQAFSKPIKTKTSTATATTNNNNNNKLRVLKLAHCDVGDSGMRALSWWLAESPECCVLQSLDLQENPAIGPLGLQALARTLKRNATLQTIDLRGCTTSSCCENHNTSDNDQGGCDCWRAQMARTLEEGNVTLREIILDDDPSTSMPTTGTTTTTTTTSCSSSFPCHARFELYMTLNQWGRQYFGTTATLTPTLWARVLGRHARLLRATQQRKQQQKSSIRRYLANSLLFQLIRARPDLVVTFHQSSSSVVATAASPATSAV